MPWLHADTIAHAECNIAQEVEAGDHLVLIADLTDGQPPAPGTRPLMYFRRTYGTWHDHE
jgi:flavin reductase (DIM6/NTAB) family NADH-FMN oxidoreductase RutF